LFTEQGKKRQVTCPAKGLSLEHGKTSTLFKKETSSSMKGVSLKRTLGKVQAKNRWYQRFEGNSGIKND
jgi:hypothetical protein